MRDDGDMVLKAASSIGAFGVSSGIYLLTIAKPYILDFILLGIASLLPTRVGIRIGVLTGLLLGPITASHLSTLTSFDTSLSQDVLDALIFVGHNGKFVLGILGGIIASLAFLFFHFVLKLHRYWSNVLASAATGLVFGAFWGRLLLILGKANLHPPPDLIPNLQRMANENTGLGAIAGCVIGIPLAAIDLILRRKRST